MRRAGGSTERHRSGLKARVRRGIARALALAAALALAGPALTPAVLAQAPPTPGPEDVSPGTRLAETKRLYNAITHNDLDGVKDAILAGADINARNTFGLTPIDVAVDIGYYEAVFYLLSIRNSQAARAAEDREDAERLAAAPPTPSAAPRAPARTAELPARQPELRPARLAQVPPPPSPEAARGGRPLPSVGFLGFGTAPMPESTPPPPPKVAPTARGQEAVPAAQPPKTKAPMPAGPRAAPPQTKAARAQETAALRPGPAERPARQTAPARARPGLGTDLVLGHRIEALDAAVRERCFAASGEQRYRICLVPVRWPASLQRAFHVQSMLYNGTAAYVLYDGGRAVSLYALFRSRAHQLVNAYFNQTFGQPAKRRRYSMTVGYRRQDENRIATWTVSGPPGEGDALIELRRFDDVRDLYADGSNGVVQVTAKGAPGVFSVLSMIDLIQHKFQRL